MPPHLKKSIIETQLENGTFEQIASNLEKELELSGLEAPDEMQTNTVTKQTTKPKPEKPKPTCHHCKKPSHYRNQCRQHKKERDQNDTNKNSAGHNKNNNNYSGHTKSDTHNNKTVTNGNDSSANNRTDRKPRMVYPPCETCGKTNHSTEKC